MKTQTDSRYHDSKQKQYNNNFLTNTKRSTAMNTKYFLRKGLMALVSLLMITSMMFAGDFINKGTLTNKVGKSFTVSTGNFQNYKATDVGGTVNNAGTITISSASKDFLNSNGTENGTLTNNIATDYGTVNVGRDFVNQTGVVTNSSTAVIDANNDVTNTTGTFTNTGIVRVFNNLTSTSGFVTTAGTVEYDGSGAQSVLGITYGTLKALTGGTKTLAGAVTASTGFEIGGGATLAVNTNTLTLNGTVTTGGTLTSANSGTVEYLGASQNVFAATYGNLTVGGSGTHTSSGTVTVNSVYTNAVSGVILSTVGFTSAVGANLSANSGTLQASGTVTIGDGLSETIGGTFNYSGATQTVAAAQYTDLTLSGNGGNVTFPASLYIAGAYSPSGTSTRDYTGSTIRFNGSGAQSIAGDASSFAALEFFNAGVKTITSSVTTTGSVTIDASVNAGDGVAVSNGIVLTVGGDLNNDGTLTNDGTITVN